MLEQSAIDQIVSHRARVLEQGDRLGLRLRTATPDDIPAIQELARSSYPVPDWLFENDENQAHYRQVSGTTTSFGIVLVRVAEIKRKDSRLAGYVFFQLRNDGDCYLRDLAARRQRPSLAVRGTGTLLVAEAIAWGLDAGYQGSATLNVLEAHRGDRTLDQPPGLWRDPVPFYERLGYRIDSGAAGYADDSPDRPLGDTWMTADMRSVFEVALANLRGMEPEVH